MDTLLKRLVTRRGLFAALPRVGVAIIGGSAASRLLTGCAPSLYTPGAVIVDGLLQARNAWTQDVLYSLAESQGVDPSSFATLLVAKALTQNGWVSAVLQGDTSERIPYPAGTQVRFEIARYSTVPVFEDEHLEEVYLLLNGEEYAALAAYWLREPNGDLRPVDADLVLNEDGEAVFGWRHPS